MISLLVQIRTSDERLFAIRDRLADGGMASEAALTFLGLAGGLLLLYFVLCLRRRGRRREMDDSQGLFHSLLSDLGLTVRQRDLMRRIARDRQLKEPAVLLVAPALYWTYATQWLESATGRTDAIHAQLESLAAVLFPQSPSHHDGATV